MSRIRSLEVCYIDHMGNDYSIVNAAHVSLGQEVLRDCNPEDIWANDIQLIQHLADHGHWTPFAHTSLTLRITAPIFIARQLSKHQVGLTWNEQSRRYTNNAPQHHYPTQYRGWRYKGEKKMDCTNNELLPYSAQIHIDARYNSLITHAKELYAEMRDMGVAPEQARMVLPQAMVTRWFWTGSLLAFHRIYIQRSHSHAQEETREIAHQISDICNYYFPYCWYALNNKGDNKNDNE